VWLASDNPLRDRGVRVISKSIKSSNSRERAHTSAAPASNLGALRTATHTLSDTSLSTTNYAGPGALGDRDKLRLVSQRGSQVSSGE
jgi:hypothetical protein